MKLKKSWLIDAAVAAALTVAAIAAPARAQSYGPLAPGQVVGNPGGYPGGAGMTATVTINGVPCVVNGANCSITATAASITPGATTVVGVNPGGILYSDTVHVQQNSNFYLLFGGLILNDTTTALASLPHLGFGGNGFYAYSTSPWIQLMGIGNHIGWGGITLAGAYNGGSGWTPQANTLAGPDILGQIAFAGFDGTNWVQGAGMAATPTQNWNVGATGTQLQWCVVANNNGYSQNCIVMTLDQTDGLGLAVPLGTQQITLGYSPSGIPVAAPAWTTGGIQIHGQGSFKDITSSGTVAAGYTNAFGNANISATNAVTFTNYYGVYFKDPVASTNVTFTNKWAKGADDAKIAGHINAAGLQTSGTISGALCQDAAGNVIYKSGSNCF